METKICCVDIEYNQNNARKQWEQRKRDTGQQIDKNL